MKKMFAFLICALFASVAFAASPVADETTNTTASESMEHAQETSYHADEETAAANAPEAADASGVQDADD